MIIVFININGGKYIMSEFDDIKKENQIGELNIHLYYEDYETYYKDDKIILDEKCFQCNSEYIPKVFRKSENGKCYYCDGIGYIPTDEGDVILNFIKRYKNLL